MSELAIGRVAHVFFTKLLAGLHFKLQEFCLKGTALHICAAAFLRGSANTPSFYHKSFWWMSPEARAAAWPRLPEIARVGKDKSLPAA